MKTKTAMLQFILKRTAYSFLILLGVMILTFILFRVAAGDPSATLLGKNPRPEEVEQLRRSLGSDKPLFYGTYLRTEAFTNADFRNGRTEFSNIQISGDAVPGKDGITLNGWDSKIIFHKNFPLDEEILGVCNFDGRIKAETGSAVGGNTPAQGTDDGYGFKIEQTADSVVISGYSTISSIRFERKNPKPWDSQFLASIKEIMSFQSTFPYVSFFNFGNTLLTQEPIREKLWRGMIPSLLLMLPIFFGELLFGIVLAMISCVWHGRFLDRLIMILSVTGMSISYLALIIFGQWLLGYYWNWFPVWGWGSARYLVLPVMIGIFSGTGSGVRFYRTVFLNEANREYLRTAVAKGASPVAVYGKHLLKNSLIPIITRASGVLPFLFTGSLLLESFFGIPGLGSEGINALHDADLQMLKALVILSSFLFVFINLVTDIVYAYADPRMRIK